MEYQLKIEMPKDTIEIYNIENAVKDIEKSMNDLQNTFLNVKSSTQLEPKYKLKIEKRLYLLLTDMGVAYQETLKEKNRLLRIATNLRNEHFKKNYKNG